MKNKKKDPMQKVRELNMIQDECNQLLFLSGNIQYQIMIKQEELGQTNEKIRELNREFHTAMKLQAKPAPQQATEVVPT